MRVLVLTLLGLGLLGGCRKPDTQAYVRSLEKMAELAEQHRHDCDAMARALDRFFERGGEAIVTYHELSHRLTKPERDAVEGPRYGPRVRAAMQRLMPAHRRCEDHDAVRQAYARYF